MSAGQKVCALGVVRFVLGEIFEAREVLLEAHHAIEATDGTLEYTRLEEHRLPWSQAKALVTAADWAAVLRFLAACEGRLSETMKKPVVKFDESKAGAPAAPFSPL